jgi:hypothetical protein
MTAAQLTRHDIETKIVKRCWENEAFRKEFVSDPAACFVKYLKASKAQLPKIVVHEEAAGSWHIVLPAKSVNTGELSDEELEKVAGGTTPLTLAFATLVAASIWAGVDTGW